MSEMSAEDQHIHRIVESYTGPLKEEIKQLRRDLESLQQEVRGIRRDVHNGFELGA